MGFLLNPSFSHLGSLEVYRIDASDKPKRVECIGFGELAGVSEITFAPDAPYR